MPDWKSSQRDFSGVVTRYCETISATAPIARYGFLVSQHDRLGAIPPPPFLRVSPLESMRSGGAKPPHKRGISAILVQYLMKTMQNGCDTLCDTTSRYCVIWGDILHWASKRRRLRDRNYKYCLSLALLAIVVRFWVVNLSYCESLIPGANVLQLRF